MADDDEVTNDEPSLGEVLESISANIGSLAEAMTDLVRIATGDMQMQTKREGRRTRLGVLAVGLLVGVLLVVSLSNRQLLDERTQVSKQIADCTDPTGTCYMKVQEQLSAVVASVVVQLNADADARTSKAVNDAVCAIRPDLCIDGVMIDTPPTP